MHAETDLILHRGRFTRSMFAVRLVQLFDFVFAVVALLLLGRFLLAYSGHRTVQPMLVELVQIADRVAAPFHRVPTTYDPAGHPLAWAYIAALLVCAVAYRLLVGATRRLARPKADFDDA